MRMKKRTNVESFLSNTCDKNTIIIQKELKMAVFRNNFRRKYLQNRKE